MADKIAVTDDVKSRQWLNRFPRAGLVVRQLMGSSAVREASSRPGAGDVGRTRTRRRLMKATCGLVVFAALATWLLTAAGFDARLSAICVAVFITEIVVSWLIIARAGRGRPPPRLRGIGARYRADASATAPADELQEPQWRE